MYLISSILNNNDLFVIPHFNIIYEIFIKIKKENLSSPSYHIQIKLFNSLYSSICCYIYAFTLISPEIVKGAVNTPRSASTDIPVGKLELFLYLLNLVCNVLTAAGFICIYEI